MPKIYLVFSNIGKTYFCKTTPNWIDLDWYIFSQANNFSDIFYKAINVYSYYGYNILINSATMAELLLQKNIKVDAIIMPCREMKDELAARCIARSKALNNPKDIFAKTFPTYFEARYPIWDKLKIPKIYVKPGQYLTDIIDADGKLKPGIKIEEADN